jgi:peptidoglycan/xylan/chitin deacetylase (PgdA/CDA1 family)
VRKLLLLLLLSCTRRPDVPILNYHSVGATADDYTVPEAGFEKQLEWLEQQGFHTTTLAQLHATQHPIVLTFDDGKEDALRLVLPALQRHQMRATFFIITALAGKPGYLTWDGVRALDKAGMEIGSHTVDHARLADLPDEKVRLELVESKRELERQLGHPVEALAYPYNSVRSRIVEAARAAGYRVAVSGAVHGGAELLNLYRLPVDGHTDLPRALAAH